MKGFAELYLNKIPNNNMNESKLSKIISESIKKVLKESKEQNDLGNQRQEFLPPQRHLFKTNLQG